MIEIWIAIFLIVLVQYFSFRHLDIKHDVVKCFLMNEIISQKTRIENLEKQINSLKLQTEDGKILVRGYE